MKHKRCCQTGGFILFWFFVCVIYIYISKQRNRIVQRLAFFSKSNSFFFICNSFEAYNFFASSKSVNNKSQTTTMLIFILRFFETEMYVLSLIRLFCSIPLFSKPIIQYNISNNSLTKTTLHYIYTAFLMYSHWFAFVFVFDCMA